MILPGSDWSLDIRDDELRRVPIRGADATVFDDAEAFLEGLTRLLLFVG